MCSAKPSTMMLLADLGAGLCPPADADASAGLLHSTSRSYLGQANLLHLPWTATVDPAYSLRPQQEHTLRLQ